MRTLFISLLVMVFTTVNGQALDSLNEYILKADVQNLTEHFSKTIDLSIENKEGIYSQTQAKIILNDFFETNMPTEYEVKHTGGNKNNSHFVIGKLKTQNKVYRTHILYNLIDNTIEIIELRFELED